MSSDASPPKSRELMIGLKVRNVMTSDLVTVPPGTPMERMRVIMREKKISGVPVAKDGVLYGLLSIEDFINWLAAGKDSVTVDECMIRDVQTVFEDDPIVVALKKFQTLHFGRFPVLERSTGRLTGVLTKGDIIKGLLKRMESELLEEEIHTYRASHIFDDIMADRKLLCLVYDIRGRDFDKAGECASGLRTTLKRMGFPPKTIRRTAIAAYETEMNLVIYADSGSIIAEIGPDKITVTAADRGPGILDIEKAMTSGFSTAPDWVRDLGFGAGMGLTNIRNCSDSMHIDSVVGEGTTLRFEILNTREASDDIARTCPENSTQDPERGGPP